MKNLKIKLSVCVLILIGLNQSTFAQEKSDNEITILFGTIQPFLLQGGNVEINYLTNKIIFEYSHGWSLELKDQTVVGEAKEQHLSLHLPYSTGFGIGYRFTENFNARFEGKLHKFQVYYEDEPFDKNNLIGEYSTVTLGTGIYYTYKPFKNKDNALKGITTSTSIRYWYKVNSTLDNDELSYFNRITNKQEIHKASEIGIANTPWLFNISIGYSFGVKTK
ncbi:MAG: hypothetical protein JKY30_06610 [Flavobacteriales bacterium]|nr:hypothetical protein [Flavobacteriales bacterium]